MKDNQQWTDLLFEMANGSSAEYDSLKGKDVFEFFALLRSYKKRLSNGK